MPKRYLTQEQIDRAIGMRERGMSIEAIRRKIGCSHSALAWQFLKAGVEPPWPFPLNPNRHIQNPIIRRGDHVVRAFTPQEDARLLELEASGVKIGAIAHALGRRVSSVKGRLMTLARHQARAEAALAAQGAAAA